ncbi:MAG TPA: phenylalanine--tRNA ligase subunit beta, partial [Candidatus Polarisedimenticolaceae bacterium]|nr:phenylalanine--tRNA ligase subunit beta [Candidatus Polarisedimenticolaceae bacterium]
MNIPVSWINQYLEKPLSAKAMAQALELAGVEVESLRFGEGFDVKIVTGEVKTVEDHHQADRLKVVTVDVKNTELTIVTGAPNVTNQAIGKKVAVATVGSILPDGTKIKAAKLRGIESSGMLCSEQELGVGNDSGGIMFLADDAELGNPVGKALSVDDVIETTTAPNRWDLNGIRWMAVEAAAQTGQNAKLEQPEVNFENSLGEPLARVDSPGLVSRFMVVRMKVLKDGSTPDWMKRQLLAAGVRSISPIVDVTNYVMLEYGQPMHAFDASKVELPLVVRQAVPGETLTTLDGIKRQLHADDLLITD